MQNSYNKGFLHKNGGVKIKKLIKNKAPLRGRQQRSDARNTLMAWG